MNKSLVSVIVPVYNSEKYLHRCIDSIVGQTYKFLEIILVNDGSTDSSLQICHNASLADSRIICISQPNKGASEARKAGIKRATGKWVMFVDSDDALEVDATENLLNFDNGKRQIIAGTLKLIPEKGNSTLFCHKKTGDFSANEYLTALLLNETSVGPVAKLIERDLFNKIVWKIPSEIAQNEDLLMLLELAKVINGTIHITNDIVCYNYFFRSNSLSKGVVMSIDTWIKVFDYIQSHIITNNNKLLNKGFLLYRLHRLYDCCILKGVNIESRRQYIDTLISTADSYQFENYDRTIIKLIKSPTRTCIVSNWSGFKRNTKRRLRKLIWNE